jgi:hypothetical protein
VLLTVGLSLAGCGSDDGGKSDSGLARDGGGADAKRDTNPDATTGDAATAEVGGIPDAVVLPDAGPDLGLADGPGIDTIGDGAADRPADGAIDAGNRDGRDGAEPDAPGLVDTAIVDGGPGMDSSFDGGISEAGSTDADSTTIFVASLRGLEEVPPVPSDATGSATFVLSADRTRVTYAITHTVANATEAHVHLGAGGLAGPVVYPLTPIAASMTGTIALNPGDADNFEQGMFYVNVHSQLYPDGEIRGQIMRPGASLWVANMTGGQETPQVTTAATGHAAVILDANKAMIRYHVTTTGLTATAAHIHKAVAAIAGPVVYPLSPLGATMDGTIAITAVDATDLAEGRWFVNAHTTGNPNGEIRGQLLMPGEVLYAAALSGANEVPPVTTSQAVGGAQFILSPSGTSVRYEASITGAAPTSAAVNNGAAGVNGPVVFPLSFGTGGLKGTLTVSAIDVTNLNAGNYYVNIMTATNPAGELRGQIMLQ